MFVSPIVNMFRTKISYSRLRSPSAGPSLNYSSSSLIVLALFLAAVQCLPMKTQPKRALIDDQMISFLTNFGYLPASDMETGNLRTDEQLRDAIRALQKFGNIPVTGEQDERTEKLLNTPRCGLADYPSSQYNKRKKRYTLQGQKWDHTNLTWSLRSKAVKNLNYGHLRRVFHEAFKLWSDHSKLSFKEMDADDADIAIYFEKGYHNDNFPFDGAGRVLAHAFFPARGQGGDAHFDEEETWSLRIREDENGSTNLFSVAAHEFGHSLGLSHSSVTESLMYPWYQGTRGIVKLPEDDQKAIQELYGVKDDKREDIYPNRHPIKPVTTPPYKPTYPYPRLPPSTVTPKPNPPPYFPYEPRRPNHNPYVPPKPSLPTPSPPARLPFTPPTTQPHPSSPPIKEHSDSDSVPKNCDTSYDAISVIRGDLFIFKDKYVWRIGEDKGLYSGFPAHVRRIWSQLPANLSHVDAVYERNDKKIVFFVGREIYMFDGNSLIRGYPRPLTSIGLPESLDHIDAAVVWGHNEKTYFFSGSVYWRYNDEIGKVEFVDYPRKIANIWSGVSDNIDAAFRWKDGATYFFKDKGFWKFDDSRMKVSRKQPTPSAPVWMGCPKALESSTEKETEYKSNSVNGFSDPLFKKILSFSNLTILVAISFLVFFLILIVTIRIRKNKTYSYSRPKRLIRR